MTARKVGGARILTGALFGLALGSSLFADGYRFTRIDVPGSTFTEARGINARGDIVGAYVDADDIIHGFLLRNGVLTTIDVPDADVTLGARAINARGDIVGTFLDAQGVRHGYLLSDGQFTEIDYPEANGSSPIGVNNAGDVAGSYADELGIERGYILKEGEFHDVYIPHSLVTQVNAAQDNGRVWVGYTVGPDGGAHGFIRSKPGQFRLIDFPGLSVPCTAARFINQRGEIVGAFAYAESVETCPDDPHHGYLLRGHEFTIVDPPHATSSRALSINDDGVIVGTFVDRQGNTHGYKAVPVDAD